MSVEAPEIGPLDYLLIEFPGTHLTGEGLPLLADLVDRGIIRVLDLVFVEKALDGTTTVLALDDLIAGGTLDLAIFQGVSSGMVDSADIADAGSVLEPGSSAGLLIYENSWAAPFTAAMRRAGGQVVASGRIPVQDVIDALDATDSGVSVSNAR